MNSGSISGQSRSFRDYKEICSRADILILDSQARSDADGFQQNADTGKLIHGLLGWDKLIPESMAMYQMGRPTFRLASKPVPEARIPYLPVHADHIDRDAKNLSLLVLPNLGLMTDTQIASVKRFAEGGGGLLATGESSLYNEWGDRRSDYALSDLFGAHLEVPGQPKSGATLRKQAGETYHTYLRLTPELRGNVDGPQTGMEPLVSGMRHPVLKGFDETDILSFGGILEPVRTDTGAEVLMTFIPQLPIYPPETAWMREPKTNIPGLILNTLSGGGRIAYLPADLDRQFGRYNLPDHGNLLANLIRWASKDDIPLAVECAGLIDCNLYHQPNRLILHLVNLTSAGTWRQPVDEYIPIGPVKVQVKLPEDIRGRNLQFRSSSKGLCRWYIYPTQNVAGYPC